MAAQSSAAKVLQAQFRGRKARAKVQKMRIEASEELDEPSAQDEEAAPLTPQKKLPSAEELDQEEAPPGLIARVSGLLESAGLGSPGGGISRF